MRIEGDREATLGDLHLLAVQLDVVLGRSGGEDGEEAERELGAVVDAGDPSGEDGMVVQVGDARGPGCVHRRALLLVRGTRRDTSCSSQRRSARASAATAAR